MATFKSHQKRYVGAPHITARRNWSNYLLGMGTEILYVLVAIVAVGALCVALMRAMFQ